MVSNKALLAAIGLLLLIVTVGSWQALQGEGHGPDDTTWERIQQQGVLVVGVDPSFPPFGIYDPGGPLGIDAELALALGESLGVQVRFVLLSYDGIYDMLYTGEIDIVIAALRPDPNHLDRFRYSRPYFDAGHVFVGLNSLPTDFAGVTGYRLAVEFASEGDVAAREAAESYDFALDRSLSVDDAIQAVLVGEVDYALVDAVSARLAAREHPELVIGIQTVIADPYVIALRRTDWRLFIALEDALTMMQENGQLAAILAGWL